MPYEDWRPRRNQSRATKTAMKRLRRMVYHGIDPTKPAHWVTTVVAPSKDAKLTLEDMRKLKGLVFSPPPTFMDSHVYTKAKGE